MGGVRFRLKTRGEKPVSDGRYAASDGRSMPATDLLIKGVLLSLNSSVMGCVLLPSWLIIDYSKGTMFTSVLDYVVLAGMCFLIMALPMYWVLRAIKLALTESERRKTLETVVAAYLAVILIFAGIYYAICDRTDYADAVQSYQAFRQADHRVDYFDPTLDSEPLRAFRGIEPRLWTGMYDYWRSNHTRKASHDKLSFDKLVAYSRTTPINKVVLRPRTALPCVLVNCLHFSVITMATVGYGDMAPKAWYAKLIVDCQVLCGLALWGIALGLAFGRIFSNWGEKL